MSLRDQVLEDLKTIFNLDEMASEHRFAGRVLQLVVDNDQLQKNALQSPGGLYDGDVLIFAKAGQLAGLQLTPGRAVDFDGRPYVIAGIIDEDGVTQITLTAAQGGF